MRRRLAAYRTAMPAVASRRQFRKRREIYREMRRSRFRHRHDPGTVFDLDGIYGDDVGAATDPRLQAFGRFIERALDDARASGLSISDVEQRTRLGRSTFYRWKRGEVATPQPNQVRQFCEGLGLSVRDAARTLGWNGAKIPVDPNPPMDADVRTILRILADPRVSQADKDFIRETLRMLARRPIGHKRDIS